MPRSIQLSCTREAGRTREEACTDAMTLFQANSGQKLSVVDVLGGPGLRRRLAQLGILPGTHLQVVRHAAFGGPLLVDVEGRVIAIGKGIAAKVLVRPEK